MKFIILIVFVLLVTGLIIARPPSPCYQFEYRMCGTLTVRRCAHLRMDWRFVWQDRWFQEWQYQNEHRSLLCDLDGMPE
jgi:hypothetical protein